MNRIPWFVIVSKISFSIFEIRLREHGFIMQGMNEVAIYMYVSIEQVNN